MRAAAVLLCLAALAGTAAAAGEAPRPAWDVRVLAVVPRPGFPAQAYVHPNGRVYEGTYDNPSGDALPSRVFEFDGTGALLRAWTVSGQDLSKAHGVQVAASDAAGRLVLLDKSPPRVLLLDTDSGRQTTYATFPAGAVPNYAAWGPDGSLYVTDYENPRIWRVPVNGGTPVEWLRDSKLDGSMFGATGIQLMPDGRTLLVGMQSEGGGASGDPTSGRLWKVPIGADGRPGPMTQLWESKPLDGPDGFAISASGKVYVALLVANAIAVIGTDGQEIERHADPLYDSPSNAAFLGDRLMVANQSYFAGDASKQAVLDVQVGEPGAKILIPVNAGPVPKTAAPKPKPRKVKPRTGRWRATGGVTFRVQRRKGRLEIRSFRVRTKDTCVDPTGTNPPTVVDVTTRLDHVRIGPKGGFRKSDGDSELHGRFTSARRMSGTLDVAGEGLTCSGATVRFTARRSSRSPRPSSSRQTAAARMSGTSSPASISMP